MCCPFIGVLILPNIKDIGTDEKFRLGWKSVVLADIWKFVPTLHSREPFRRYFFIFAERHTGRSHKPVSYTHLPHGSCCGPGFWNIQYNSLLGLDFARHSSVIAFGDDVIVVIKGKSVIKAENYANIEIQKIIAVSYTHLHN